MITAPHAGDHPATAPGRPGFGRLAGNPAAARTAATAPASLATQAGREPCDAPPGAP
jgi:hypothetical protein